jgi:glycosidase
VVDLVFGTLAGLDGLLAAAYARRLRVLAGLVPDHTSTGTRGSFEPGQPAAGQVREG